MYMQNIVAKSSELLNRPDVQLITFILFLWFAQLKNMMLDDERAVIYNVQNLCTFALNLATLMHMLSKWFLLDSSGRFLFTSMNVDTKSDLTSGIKLVI
jgi:hypothetical protein